MQRSPAREFDLVLAAAGAFGVAGLVWLAPLMFDQLVFFADQDQTTRAQASRQAMIPAATLLILAAAGLTARQRPWHALLVALPALVAVPLALLAPDAAYQLLAYGISAPMSLGALLSAFLPLPRVVPLAIQFAGLGMLVLMGIVATPLIAIVALAGVLVWWRLPEPERLALPHRR